MSQVKTKAELLAEMQREYENVEQMIGSLSEAQLTLPGIHPDSEWTIKDTMAHLAAWMKRATSRLPGRTPLPDPFPQANGETWDAYIDRLNQYFYQQSRGLPLGVVLADFRAAYRQMREVVQSLTDEQIADEKVNSAIEIDSFGHYREHLNTLAPWLERINS